MVPSQSLVHLRLQGDLPQYFYVVEEGQFDVVLPPNGSEQSVVLHSYRAGNHANSAFGELALVTGKPHGAKTIAATDGEPGVAGLLLMTV